MITNNDDTGIAFLMIIVGRNQRNPIFSELSKAGVRIMNVTYGKGSVKASYLMDTLGLIPEENKAVILCLLPGEKVDEVLDLLINKFRFNEPNTGIAFTIPVDELSF